MSNRRKELDKIFKDVKEKDLINPLLDEIVFLEKSMSDLKKVPFIKINPNNQNQQKITPAAKLYKEYSQSYMNAIRILVNILRKVDSSAADELLERLKEFT